MTKSTFEESEPTDTTSWNCTWLITAPWAHPAWSQYILALYDLTYDVGHPPKIYLEGATHEFLLYAVDPKYPLSHDKSPVEQQPHYLHPANHGYQFKAVSNGAARARMQLIVDDIDNTTLSPDTDFRQLWDRRFADAHSLKR